ncbi:MAG: cysteine hydrolase [Lachnospiraceae bacterium]|nr:cysteine hydrolase [Lachnospiraceae bacterium]
MILLVIDIQKGITDERLYDYEGFINRTSRIISASRDKGVEVIYVQHDDGPGTGFSIGDEEFEIADAVAPKSDEKIFVKIVNSCFGNKELAEYLDKQEDKSLMIVGLQTNYCIDASIKSAFDRGFKVIIPEGTNSTFDNDYMDKETTYRYYNELIWPDRFAECVSLDAAISFLSDHNE